jgi:Transcriptional regulator
MEYIVALEEYRHFVLAAESCGVTQPSLSAMVQKLEDELDVTLFTRDRKKIAPTPIGEKVIAQARIILKEARMVKELISDELESTSGNLQIGILPTVAPYLVPDFIKEFQQAYPRLNLLIEEKDNSSLMLDLLLGKIDMAITTSPEADSKILEIPVYREPFVGYFSCSCPDVIDMVANGKLPADRMWILKEGHCVPNGALSVCGEKSIGNHTYEAGSIETLIRIVDKNGGFTIIPQLHCRFLNEEQKQNVHSLEHIPSAQRTVSLVIKGDYIRERMINAVYRVVRGIIPGQMWVDKSEDASVALKSRVQ